MAALPQVGQDDIADAQILEGGETVDVLIDVIALIRPLEQRVPVEDRGVHSLIELGMGLRGLVAELKAGTGPSEQQLQHYINHMARVLDTVCRGDGCRPKGMRKVAWAVVQESVSASWDAAMAGFGTCSASGGSGV